MQEAHTWSQRLDLNHDVLDAEHHLQVAMIGALAEAIEQRRPAMARRLAEQLEAYSIAHFTGEELVMESSEYSRASDHHAEHQGIVERIREVRALVEEDLDQALAPALDLLTGIASHISASDRAFGQHLSERRRPRGEA